MALHGLAGALALGLFLLAAFLAIVWFLLPSRASQPCPGCGSRRPAAEQRCALCGAAMPGPAEAHPGAPPYGFPPPAPARPGEATRIEGGVAFNRGVTRRIVTLATAAMGLGIGVRLAGMLGVLGIPTIPLYVDGLLTLAGGLAAFVGFVFLDAA